jgi:hypothetical protein
VDGIDVLISGYAIKNAPGGKSAGAFFYGKTGHAKACDEQTFLIWTVRIAETPRLQVLQE